MNRIRYLIQFSISIQNIYFKVHEYKYRNFSYKYKTGDILLFRDKSLKLLISNYIHGAMIIVIDNKIYILDSSYINGLN